MVESVGKNIQFYRKQRGLTQEQLAEAVGVSLSSIKQIERGKSYPLMENFINICKTLGVPADFIIADLDKKFRISAAFQMMERLATLEDSSLESVTDAIEMIYLLKSQKIESSLKSVNYKEIILAEDYEDN